jgi:hypothetical protein
MQSDTLAAHEAPRPALVVEPAAESTRALLGSLPAEEARIVAPDPEEKRLSHELDFGTAERQRQTGTGGGTRRVVVILILLIILAGIAAVVFKTQIIAAVPSLKPIYAQGGL